MKRQTRKSANCLPLKLLAGAVVLPGKPAYDRSRNPLSRNRSPALFPFTLGPLAAVIRLLPSPAGVTVLSTWW